jgi:predicted nucleic acid-binding protein
MIFVDRIGEELLERCELAVLHTLDASDKREAWEVFRRFHDKEWSFTDCTSKVLIERLGITTAFTFDHHFKQFGTVAVVP